MDVFDQVSLILSEICSIVSIVIYVFVVPPDNVDDEGRLMDVGTPGQARGRGEAHNRYSYP